MIRTALAACVVLSLGCGSSAPPPSAPKPNAAVVNGCTGGDYGDHTTEPSTTVKWDESIEKSFDRCIRVKVGQSVSYEGDFSKHPMEASGGDSESPFKDIAERVTNAGTPQEAVAFKFTKTGVFGYKCTKHPSMAGAVLVVP
jgi:plastocyanin